MQNIPQNKIEKPSFWEAFWFWFKLGWISFGGTTGHITIMHDFLVEKKKWVSDSKFFHILNACMILPGPEAHQTAIYIGWKLHGIKGGIISGLFFILPSTLILLALSIIYAIYGNHPFLISLFDALKPAVLAIILFATYKVAKKSLLSVVHIFVAFAAFILSFFVGIPMPWIILGIIVLGILIQVLNPKILNLKKPTKEHLKNEENYYINSLQENPKISIKKLFLQFSVFVVLWIIPFLMLIHFSNDGAFFTCFSLLFTKAAFFTIGGSYTVIPYVANLVTQKLHWLTNTQMVDGFALAETTPGPLVIVLAYVGFMAAFNNSEHSLLIGSIGLLAAAYFTFLPNFMLIFLGGPFIEKWQKKSTIQAVLSLVTAGVVGVIVNLAFYLGENVLFYNSNFNFENINWISLIWAGVCLLLLTRFKVNMIYVILLSIGFGVIRYFLI
ncbi:chromate efflux transporter [Soonwooa sp.]|uniref:chromate efflux transporter n=1 Tax=Soonwooa sp. TaxID=1938592 RepID=UPI002619316D|nr:chromate efflux transporter [Soonwooa sp.]